MPITKGLFKTQLYIQLVFKAPLSFILRIRIWVVAYCDPRKNSKQFQKICIYKLDIMQLFIANAKRFDSFLLTNSSRKNQKFLRNTHFSS